MLSKSLLAVAFAGAATAVTPTGFQPVSNSDLIVAFGNKLALNGKMMTKAETARAPTIGTTQRLMGKYTLVMVDPDIPPQMPGGPTGELLHWMQQDLTSASTATMVGGMMIFVLSSTSNNTAFAPYFGPSPPNKAPNTHRYTQLLLDTSGTNSSGAIASLKRAGATRMNFNAVNVVKAAGVPIVAGNSFDVMNGTATATATNGTSSAPPPPAAAAAAPINSATLVAATITKPNGPNPNPGAQQPAAAAPPAPATAGIVNGTSGAATNGATGAARNGTAPNGTAPNGIAGAARNGTAGAKSGSPRTSTNGTTGATKGSSGTAKNGTAGATNMPPGPSAAPGAAPGAAKNGTKPVGGTSGFGHSGGGAYLAGLIALAAALFLL